MRVAVVGGGLQGIGVALELALRGVSVDLFEKRDACLGQASFQNEGKIHLGFTYAKDRTLATARLMVEGAFQFEPIVRRWLDTAVDSWLCSSPFHYFVHRDSLLDSDAIGAHYQSVSSLARDAAAKPDRSYFGADGGAPARRLSAGQQDHLADSRLVPAIFATPELAIDPEAIGDLLRGRVAADKRIQVHVNTSVTRVERSSDAASVTVDGPHGVRTERYEHVVNASWEDLVAIDASADIVPDGEWSFRVKHFLRIGADFASIDTPSVTVVLGGFGDVVRYANGCLILSWYPVGRRGLSSDIKPPNWPLPLGEPDASAVRAGIHQGLCSIMPWLRNLSPPAIASAEVKGGIIYALGDTDVGDPSSRLHERYQVGLRSFGRYHSVNTGKYSLAPFFARLTAERIMGDL